MKNIIGQITSSFLAMAIMSAFIKKNNMINLKTSRNNKKKCIFCKNDIIKEQRYIEVPYEHFYIKEVEIEKKNSFSRILNLNQKKKEQISYRIRYKRVCDDCLYWLFENHLKEGYDEWLGKQVAERI